MEQYFPIISFQRRSDSQKQLYLLCLQFVEDRKRLFGSLLLLTHPHRFPFMAYGWLYIDRSVDTLSHTVLLFRVSL